MRDDVAKIINGELGTEFDVVAKFGQNLSVPDGSFAPVTGLGSINWLTAATAVRIKAGGDAADTAAGAGARSVTIVGLDGNGNEVSETVATAGASASAVTENTFLRVYRAYLTTSGAYTGSNTGNIVVENGSGGTDLIQITAGQGQSQFCGYTIPAGFNAYVVGLEVNVDGKKPADIAIYTRAGITATSAPFAPKRLRHYIDGAAGSLYLSPKSPLITTGEMTDIWVEAQGGGAGTEASVSMNIILIRS